MEHTYTGMFRFHPEKGASVDGFVDHDKQLIKKSVENLIKTPKGSRVYDPEYGTNLHRLIHELNIERIRNIAKTEIQFVIEKYEPRVKITRIEAYADGSVNQNIVVVMTLFYIEFNTEEILEIKFASDNQWINNDAVDTNPLEGLFNDSLGLT